MNRQSLPYRTPVFRTVAERDVRLAATVAVAFTATFSLAIATQHVAALLGNSAVLGAPVVSLPLVGSLYRPWGILVWAWEWQHVAAAEPMLSAGMRIFEYPTLVVTVVAMIAVSFYAARRNASARSARFSALGRQEGDQRHWAARCRWRRVCWRMAKWKEDSLSPRLGAIARARFCADAHRQRRGTGNPDPAQLAPQRRGPRHQRRELEGHGGLATEGPW
jgi:hypothetical protein